MTFNKRTWGLVLASLIFFGGATSAFAGEKPRVGGAYFVTSYRGYGPSPEQQVNAHPLTAEDYDALAYLDQVCREDLKPQQPNTGLEIATDVTLYASGAAIGGFVGSTAAFDGQIDAGKQATYAGGGSGLAAGITGHFRADRYDLGQCMSLQVQWAQKFDGQLQGKGIIMNSHSINGKPIKRSRLPVASSTETSGDPVVNDSSTVP